MSEAEGTRPLALSRTCSTKASAAVDPAGDGLLPSRSDPELITWMRSFLDLQRGACRVETGSTLVQGINQPERLVVLEHEFKPPGGGTIRI